MVLIHSSSHSVLALTLKKKLMKKRLGWMNIISPEAMPFSIIFYEIISIFFHELVVYGAKI